jgi:hypothetical protein
MFLVTICNIIADRPAGVNRCARAACIRSCRQAAATHQVSDSCLAGGAATERWPRSASFRAFAIEVQFCGVSLGAVRAPKQSGRLTPKQPTMPL